ncbi:HalOD1 output domain-containing protein [Halobellus rarus]|uniref:HalOD1 output domain-containing protein n=1 Tax=Halobellus rarus TaxID=1126237 RepID=A0ABD6CME3_9EURY|nr:HalOD1 output domain-containing protein [Halobellus rarus]
MSVSNRTEALSANTYQYERERDELPSEAVVAAVSEVSNRPVVTPAFGGDERHADALSPLHDYVDPDALDALVTAQSGTDSKCSVTFTYGKYTVTVEKWMVTVTRST